MSDYLDLVAALDSAVDLGGVRAGEEFVRELARVRGEAVSYDVSRRSSRYVQAQLVYRFGRNLRVGDSRKAILEAVRAIPGVAYAEFADPKDAGNEVKINVRLDALPDVVRVDLKL